MKRSDIAQSRRWVIKVGSALLTDDGAGLNVTFIHALASQIADLKAHGIEVILVSSGSVAAGLSQLGMTVRPKQVAELQATAAVGQASLVRHYEQAFKPYSIHIAQILLTHADISNRERYLNTKSALSKLLELGVLAVINENDTVATDEICFGDNDTLASLVANLINADLLVILTDQQGLFTADPRQNNNAELIEQAEANDASLRDMASEGGTFGRGGMLTKLTAAQNAARSGASTVIAYGRADQVLEKVRSGEQIGTLLTAKLARIKAKKQWLAGQTQIQGKVVIDEGAANVLRQSGRSLLPVGVVEVIGSFKRGELIACVDHSDVVIAKGLSNYNAEEAEQIKGLASQHIAEALGYGGEQELIHRDNLVVS